MTDRERRREAAEAWLAGWYEVDRESLKPILKCDDGTGMFWAFDAGAESEAALWEARVKELLHALETAEEFISEVSKQPYEDSDLKSIDAWAKTRAVAVFTHIAGALATFRASGGSGNE